MDRQWPKEEQALTATEFRPQANALVRSKVPIRDDPSCSVAILVKKSAESVDSLDWCRAVEALLGGIRDRYLETNPTMLAGWIAD